MELKGPLGSGSKGRMELLIVVLYGEKTCKKGNGHKLGVIKINANRYLSHALRLAYLLRLEQILRLLDYIYALSRYGPTTRHKDSLDQHVINRTISISIMS